MLIFKKAAQLQQHIQQHKNNKEIIGFVPTMGALHQGHISLIEDSIKNCTITVCSIFVNPTQFNDANDFEKYPVTIEQDILLLELAKCDILFLPSVEEMYPQGALVKTNYNIGFIETVFEGAKRPGHFNGVCQIVEKLLHIVMPNYLFLGQKDYQQCIVIKKLVHLMHKEEVIKVIICNTSREENGLAMSSRNRRLTGNAKDNAKIIYQSFSKIKKEINKINAVELIETATVNILNAGFEKIDYISFANAQTLEPISEWNGNTPLIILFAGFIDGVRLIDNMLIN